jgi:glutamate synthase (NADPH/NADH) large chain
MVDIDPISADRDDDDGSGRPAQRPTDVSDYGMGDVLRHDADRLRILLERHVLHTGSAQAKALLENWPSTIRHFVKVMPRDYRRALQQIEAERIAAAAVAAE